MSLHYLGKHEPRSLAYRYSLISELGACVVQDVSLLLIGGLMMALAVEKCQLHARIALKILLLFGTKPAQ